MSERVEKLEAKLEKARERAQVEDRLAAILEQRNSLLEEQRELKTKLEEFVVRRPRAEKPASEKPAKKSKKAA